MIELSGLEEFGSDKSKCQDHFDVYKECKKKEVVVNSHLGFWCYQPLYLPYILFLRGKLDWNAIRHGRCSRECRLWMLECYQCLRTSPSILSYHLQ